MLATLNQTEKDDTELRSKEDSSVVEEKQASQTQRRSINLRETHQIRAPTRRRDRTERFMCETCNKRFYQSSDLRRHMRVHDGKTPYEVCI